MNVCLCFLAGPAALKSTTKELPSWRIKIFWSNGFIHLWELEGTESVLFVVVVVWWGRLGLPRPMSSACVSRGEILLLTSDDLAIDTFWYISPEGCYKQLLLFTKFITLQTKYYKYTLPHSIFSHVYLSIIYYISQTLFFSHNKKDNEGLALPLGLASKF